MTKQFLSKNKILYRFQSGLRKNFYTNTCLGHLTDKITTRFKKYRFTGMILIDLQKALDMNDHQILLKKKKIRIFSKTQLHGLNRTSVNKILKLASTLITSVLLIYYVSLLKDLF